MVQKKLNINKKLKKLKTILHGYKSVLVAYSGGADSAFLTAICHQIQGLKVVAVTANSPSLSKDELLKATKLANDMCWNHLVIKTNEMDNPEYVRNDGKRCFFCKTELYFQLKSLANKKGFLYVANGSNFDDTGDYRPGMTAATDAKIVSPLIDSELHKKEIRELSRHMGLKTWDKPAQPCLSSRIPYGTPVSIETLKKIGFAEKTLRENGFPIVRVRHFGGLAKIEIPMSDFGRFNEPSTRETIKKRILEVGYDSVELDPLGFRSGNLNSKIKNL
ncbi:ATP-dependent sacrificial sulfur transferase LarE [Dehalococcoidia bacterium]|nr:ATP-dependent sacrificial sulfur transferase LarE [Dehalococcoidia bacterium]